MYNKVRGILRAKKGSQIPKLLLGGNSFNFETSDNWKNLGESIKQQGQDLGITPPIQLNFKHTSGSTEPVKKESFWKKTGNFLTSNTGYNVMGAAADGITNAFFKDTVDSEGFGVVNLGIDTVSNALMGVNPMAGTIVKGAGMLLNGINSIGGKKADSFSINQATAEQVGGSYGGSMNMMTDAASKAGKKYGLFNNRSRKKANSQIKEANRQLNIMTGIAEEASDMQAMAGNNLNYLSYQTNLSGGYDLQYMRAAKQGMKINDRINLVKSRNISKHVINTDTKLIEEFKEGGVLNWKPEIIEDLNLDWKPTIESFLDGGKTKQELETPEIEETTQKNVIPEGALHKNKHHIEHTEGLTLKGIPVVDNEGELLAEIEHSEIIFTLEVTKKLEELYEDYYDEGASLKEKDEAAIEAGKLLVYQILFNTDDRTDLIKSCKNGGKL